MNATTPANLLPDLELSPAEQKLAKLLASGVSNDVAASAVGLSAGRVSQIAADPNFAAVVSAIKFETLTNATNRDAKYDQLEDAVLLQLERVLPMMYKSSELLNAMSRINQAKRRGAGADITARASSSKVVNITMPTMIVQKFTTNINNQVVRAGEQDLLTLPSNSLQDFYDANTTRIEGAESSGTGSSTGAAAA